MSGDGLGHHTLAASTHACLPPCPVVVSTGGVIPHIHKSLILSRSKNPLLPGVPGAPMPKPIAPPAK